MDQPAIALSYTDTELKSAANQLAKQLNLDIASDAVSDYDLLLQLTPEHLALYTQGDKALGPISVDFNSAKLNARLQQADIRKQPLIKAIGIKHQTVLQVLDATAGFGRDAYLLAQLGCQVTMLERHPIMAALLADGLQRMQADIALQLVPSDARAYMQTLPAAHAPDVVYLDPMFPKRPKSALVKKDMQVLQKLLGVDEDLADLLAAAKACAKQRVVVKRPQWAEPIVQEVPDFCIKSKKHRYDVFLKTDH